MTSWERPGDRMSTCPACGGDVRITDDELELGQSFCGLCDRPFDVVTSSFGDGPLRQVALVEAAHTQAPDARVAVRPDGRVAIRARSLGPQIFAVSGLALGIWIAVSRFDSFFSSEGIILSFFFGIVLWSIGLGSRETLGLDGETLVLATGPFGIRRRRIPLAELADVTVERSHEHTYSAVLVLRSGKKVPIGARFAASAETAAWLRERVLALRQLSRGSEDDRWSRDRGTPGESPAARGTHRRARW